MLLKELKIITKVPYADGTWYIKGEYCMNYRMFNENYAGDLCVVIIETAVNKLEFEKDDYKHDQNIVRTIKKIQINYNDAVLGELKYNKDNNLSLNNLRLRLNTLFMLNQKRYIKKGHKVDRIHHSFSNLPKISRKHIHINGQKFNDIDVKNCQPLLLCYLIKKLGMELDLQYKNNCQDGKFYESFIILDVDDMIHKYNLTKTNNVIENITTVRNEIKNSYTRMYFLISRKTL